MALEGNYSELAKVEDFRALLSKCEKGDKKAHAELRDKAKKFPPAALREFAALGDVAEFAEQAIIKRMAGDNLFLHETVKHKTDVIRADLRGLNPPPLELLLIDRIALCWLSLHYYEILEAQTTGGTSVAWAEFHERRLERAQKRYQSAIKALAQVRKLQLPNVQVNIGEKQVNIANVEA